jgi:hypothetical protein
MMNFRWFIRCFLSVCLVAYGSLCAEASYKEVQSWSNSKGGQEFGFYVNCCAGAPVRYDPRNPFLTEITVVKNSGGFVTIQGKITNNAFWRKTFRIRWEWKSLNGLMSTAPSDAALTMVTLAGKEQEVIQGTSTVPNPTGVVLTLFPHAK